MNFMKITIEFWDFIEKYLPDYSKRDDVIRHSNLQLFIDGHESDVDIENLTVEEAEKQLSSISLTLCNSAIDAYTKGLGVVCEECQKHKTKYCPHCGKRTDNDIIEDPYRCEECGLLQVQELAWVDTNTQIVQGIFPVEEQDRYCKYCEDHTHQLKESELLDDIQNWWEQLDSDTIEVITNLEYESFITEPDSDKAFIVACNEYWNALSVEQKIEIRKHYTYDNREN